MRVRLTSRNRLTLPKAIIEGVPKAAYFEVQARDGEIFLTPVRIQRADAVRAKLSELSLGEQDVSTAVNSARRKSQTGE